MADLTTFTFQLNKEQKHIAFEFILRKLAAHRNLVVLYASIANGNQDDDDFAKDIHNWGQSLLKTTWAVCEFKEDRCPSLTPDVDTAIRDLKSKLPDEEQLRSLLNAILLLHLTDTKEYSCHTRTLLFSLGSVDELAIVATLKNPDKAMDRAQKRAEEIRHEHSTRKTLRYAGMGAAAVAGGILVGVTGGLAAPLVGAGAGAVLGVFGLGGTAAGLLVTGLAGSSIVCGALFGAYGARSASQMIENHTRDVKDLALIPLHKTGGEAGDTLSVRLCVSGWVESKEDITEPWKVFTDDDTFALQWEVEALEALSKAVTELVKSQIISSVKSGIIRQTIFASLLSALAPVALLQIGKVLDNPWMNAKALAKKTGAVLGEVLANRAFGNRPVTLSGFFLGSTVIFEALLHLASLPPSQGSHIVQDVFLFGSPVTSDAGQWALVRRVVSGRLVNAYSENDSILAVACRISSTDWNVAGLQSVDAHGVENIVCEVGYSEWTTTVGDCLAKCGAPGLDMKEVEKQRAVEAQAEQDAGIRGEEREMK